MPVSGKNSIKINFVPCCFLIRGDFTLRIYGSKISLLFVYLLHMVFSKAFSDQGTMVALGATWFPVNELEGCM